MNTVVWLQTGAAAALNGAFAWLAGVLFVRLWLQGPYPDLLLQLDSTLRRGALAAAAVCIVASLGSLWAATALMADTALADAVPMLPSVLLETAYGRAGLYGIGAIAVAAVLQLAGAARWAGGAAALMLFVFALARASVSHAGEHGMASASYAIEVLHLVLIGVWLGGVALAACVILPAARTRAISVPGYLASLSAAATVALAGIFASGAYNSWQRLGAPEELISHPYGQALAWKLALFVIAALLGGYNRFAGFPLAAHDGGSRALQVLRIETGVLVLVLLAAARLTVQQPPG